jgi:hypothetical protein
MRTNWTSATVVAAVLSLAGCGSRETTTVVSNEIPSEASHGGTVVVLGDSGPRVEVVHRPSTGTIFVYPLRDGDRVVAFESAPVIEVKTSTGVVVPVTLVRVEGDRFAWSGSDEALRSESFSGLSLVATLDGRRVEEPLSASAWSEPTTTATPASLPPEEPAAPTTESPEPPIAKEPATEPVPAPSAEPPASDAAAPVKPAEEPAKPAEAMEPEAPAPEALPDAPAPAAEPAPADATAKPVERRIRLPDDAGSVQLVHDPKTSTLTVQVTGADGAAIEPENVVLLIEAKEEGREPTKVVLARVDPKTTAWTASGDTLKGIDLVGRIRVTIAGKDHEASLSGATIVEETKPVEGAKPVEGEAPSPAPAPSNPPAVPSPKGSDAAYRQELPFPDAAAPADEEPVNPPDPHPEPAGKPGPANPPQSDSKASEARVVLEGSFLLAIPSTEDRLEVLHDKTVGKITVQGVRGANVLSFDEAPVLFLPADDGPKQATLMRLEGKPSVWWVTHAALKDVDVVGKIRLKVGGVVHELDLAGPRLTPEGDYVVIGTARYEVERDVTSGALTLRGTGVEGMTFVLRTVDGKLTPVTFARVEGQPNTFRATHEAFKNPRLEGRVTGRMGGREVEGVIRAGASAKADVPAGGATAPSGTR